MRRRASGATFANDSSDGRSHLGSRWFESHQVELMTRLSHPRESLEVVLAMAVAGQIWGPEARSDAVDLLRRPWKRHRRLGGGELSELLAGYRAGVPVNDLADTFAIHRNTVLGLARRAGVAQRYRLIDRHFD